MVHRDIKPTNLVLARQADRDARRRVRTRSMRSTGKISEFRTGTGRAILGSASPLVAPVA